MLRAVLDSSVLVSALITPRGTPGAVLDAAERRAFTLCLSPEILAETSRVLTRNPKLQARYGYDQAHVAQFCAGLAAWAQIETNLPELRGAVPLDPKDDAIVATAVKAKADYLVTGDRKHLLALETYESIRIVTPRQFLESPHKRLKGSEQGRKGHADPQGAPLLLPDRLAAAFGLGALRPRQGVL